MSAYTPPAPGCGLPPGRNPLFALAAVTTLALMLVIGDADSGAERDGQYSYTADAVADTLRNVMTVSGRGPRGAS